MRMTLLIRLLAPLLCLGILCGCSGDFIGEDKHLMRPPYPAGEARRIQEQLTKKLGAVTLKYPKTGSYRSAIIQYDLDGDGRSEALVFYREKESEPIQIAVLQRGEKQWELVSTKKSEGGEVDRVIFGDIDNDGNQEIVVGWTMYSTGLNIISTYRFADRQISAIEVREYSEVQTANISVAYTDMQVYDFDNDGCDEIIASYINLSEMTATAKLLEYHRGVDNSDAMSVTDTAPLDGHVLRYAETKIAKLTDDGIYGVVLDGYKDNSTMITEYVYWDSRNIDLITPFYDESEFAVTCTARNIYAASRDIDSDGVIDIPVTSLLPGYDETSENPVYLTSWYNIDFEDATYTFISRKRTVLNTADNYSVTWQTSWNGAMTCRLDSGNHILSFYRYQKDKFAFSDEIFRIRVFSEKEWKQQLSDAKQNGIRMDYTILASDNDNVYVAIFSPGQNMVDTKAVSSYFSLMS